MIEQNKKKLRDLYLGKKPGGYAVIIDPPVQPVSKIGNDYTLCDKPLCDWLPNAREHYAGKVKWLNEIHDDSVPYVNIVTNTVIYAAAFGCKVHEYADSRPAAVALIDTPEQADKLKIPDFSVSPTLSRILEFARLLQKEFGPDVPISVPDIQSPFDIAAQIWNKESLFIALYENPESVKELVSKCKKLLTAFLTEYFKTVPNRAAVCCMDVWGPPELGINVSEDEVGSISAAAFEEFCLPSLIELSKKFGGSVIHCCAKADHSHAGFNKIPNLYAHNRIMRSYTQDLFFMNPTAAILDFPDRVVRMCGWHRVESVAKILEIARPESRFLFEMCSEPLEDAKKTLEAVRKLCAGRNINKG